MQADILQAEDTGGHRRSMRRSCRRGSGLPAAVTNYIMPPPARVCAACKATKSRCDNFGLGLTCDRCTRLGLRCEPAPPLAHMPRTRDFADPKGQAAPAPGRSVPANSTCKDRLGADHRMSIAPRCALASNCMSWKGTMSWNGGVVPFFHERNITHERHINI